MTNEELAVIEARVEAATPGPWGICPFHKDEIQPMDFAGCAFATGDLIADICLDYTDAEFIAAARTDVPALIAEIRQLQAEIEELARELTLLKEGIEWTG